MDDYRIRQMQDEIADLRRRIAGIPTRGGSGGGGMGIVIADTANDFPVLIPPRIGYTKDYGMYWLFFYDAEDENKLKVFCISNLATSTVEVTEE